MAYKQPGAGKDLLLFLLVDVLVDKELAADKAVFQVDEGFDRMMFGVGGHHSASFTSNPANHAWLAT